jgi:hypothetical protein
LVTFLALAMARRADGGEPTTGTPAGRRPVAIGPLDGVGVRPWLDTKFASQIQLRKKKFSLYQNVNTCMEYKI